MTTFKTAQNALIAAMSDPDDPEKLNAAKKHPKLKEALKGFSAEDMKTLRQVAMGKATGGWKCNDSQA